MADLYDILQDTQAQVDRFKTGLKQATLFEKPKTTIHPSHTSNPAWRNTVVSIYVDAEEDYSSRFGQDDNESDAEGSDRETDNKEAANEVQQEIGNSSKKKKNKVADVDCSLTPVHFLSTEKPRSEEKETCYWPNIFRIWKSSSKCTFSLWHFPSK